MGFSAPMNCSALRRCLGSVRSERTANRISRWIGFRVLAVRWIDVAVVFACLVPLSSWANGPGDWRERSQAAGDWSGVRSALGKRGVDLHATYTSGVWSNVRGGLDTGTRYEGFADWGIDSDLEDLVGWRDARFYIDWHSYHGGQPSEDLVGSFPATAISGHEAERSIRFYQIFLEQRWLDGHVVAKAGQLALDEDFMVSDSAQVLRNAVFGDFTSSSVTADVAVYPVAGPGLFLAARPFSNWHLRVGVYSGDPGEDEKDNIGFDWSISSDAGATIAAEVEMEPSPFGLAGSYSLGTLIQTGDVENYETGRESNGAAFIYAMIDQTLLDTRPAEGGAGARLSGFLRILLPTRRDRTETDWRLNGGFALAGPLPGRDEDAAALGFSYEDFSHDYLRQVRSGGTQVTSSELALELTDPAQITGRLTIQPGVQYFEDPHLGRRNALALGLSVVIEL
jgi:porin